MAEKQRGRVGRGDPAEKQREQEYFDNALEHREKARHAARLPATVAADAKAVVGLQRANDALLRNFRPPGEAVAFGRIDTDEGEAFYIGHETVWDGDNEPLVVNWRSKVGNLFYEATPDDRQGVTRRRRFDCDENRILDFEDAVLAELARRVAEVVAGGTTAGQTTPGGATGGETVAGRTTAGAGTGDRGGVGKGNAGEGAGDATEGALAALAPGDDLDDALLAELERARTVEMGDIVRTIRAAQHRVFRAGLDQVLVVQGGPGTGKTVVALHRVSWLLYTHHETLSPADVLVIGPNPTFVRYIRKVLPSLGDRDVEQVPLAALGPDVRLGRQEPPEATALKGSARMAGLLDRALADRVSLPPGQGPLEVPVGNRVVRFERAAVQAQIDGLRSSPYAVGRRALRGYLVRNSRAQGATEARADVADALLERIWPQLSAPAFLQELLGSESRLIRAAGEHFTAREVGTLRRRPAERISAERWSMADVALLDHLQARMTGQPARRYGHVVIDEAQDLSPMQLASIGRRSESGSMTLLGDIAQSTGPWARDSWDDIVTALGSGRDVEHAELVVGYRVPRQAYDVAARLLPVAAPGVRPPRVVRDGPRPAFHRSDDPASRANKAVEEAMAYAARGLLVGVIRPAACADELAAALEGRGVRWSDASSDGLGTGINVLGPDEAKGLEFDAVVVVEPDVVAGEDGGGTTGLRRLYVALTRTTGHLSIVHVGRPFPELSAYASPGTSSRTGGRPAERRPVPPARYPRGNGNGRDHDDDGRTPWHNGQTVNGTTVTPPGGPGGTAAPGPAVSPQPGDRGGEAPIRRSLVVELMARNFADEVKETLDPRLWPEVAAAVAAHLAGDLDGA